MSVKKSSNTAGSNWTRTFPLAKRAEYLALQLSLERAATHICFLTPSLTNALTTVEHLRGPIYRDLNDGLAKTLPPHRIEAVREEAFDLMEQRREQLNRRLHQRKLVVRALFLKDNIGRDLRRSPEFAMPRYQLLLKLAEASMVAFRLINRLDSAALEDAGGSFALIYNAKRSMVEADVALASAAQATSPRLSGRQFVAQNTPVVIQRIALFERCWNAAATEYDSRSAVAKAITRMPSRQRR